MPARSNASARCMHACLFPNAVTLDWLPLCAFLRCLLGTRRSSPAGCFSIISNSNNRMQPRQRWLIMEHYEQNSRCIRAHSTVGCVSISGVLSVISNLSPLILYIGESRFSADGFGFLLICGDKLLLGRVPFSILCFNLICSRRRRESQEIESRGEAGWCVVALSQSPADALEWNRNDFVKWD